MLIPLSLQLSRARRQKRLLPIFPVTTYEIATAIIQAAVQQKKELVLSLPAHQPELISQTPLFELLLEQIERTLIPISLIIESQQTLSALLEQPETVELPRGYTVALTADCCTNSLPPTSHSKEPCDLLLRYTTLPSPSHCQSSCLNNKVVGIILTLLPPPGRSFDCATLAKVAELNHTCRVPLILTGLHPAKQLADDLLKSGVAAVILSHQPEEAYTAGLRTALRNHEQSNPVQYSKVASKAVFHWAELQLRYPLQLT